MKRMCIVLLLVACHSAPEEVRSSCEQVEQLCPELPAGSDDIFFLTPLSGLSNEVDFWKLATCRSGEEIQGLKADFTFQLKSGERKEKKGQVLEIMSYSDTCAWAEIDWKSIIGVLPSQIEKVEGTAQVRTNMRTYGPVPIGAP